MSLAKVSSTNIMYVMMFPTRSFFMVCILFVSPQNDSIAKVGLGQKPGRIFFEGSELTCRLISQGNIFTPSLVTFLEGIRDRQRGRTRVRLNRLEKKWDSAIVLTSGS